MAKILYELQSGDLTTVVKVDAGKLVNETVLDSKGIKSTLLTEVPLDYFLDKLAEAIPGELDDAVISMLKAALAKV